MTDKERREFFDNIENWEQAVEAPNFGAFSTWKINYHGLVVYDFRVQQRLTDIRIAGAPKIPKWIHQFWYLNEWRADTIELVSLGEIKVLMKEAEEIENCEPGMLAYSLLDTKRFTRGRGTADYIHDLAAACRKKKVSSAGTSETMMKINKKGIVNASSDYLHEAMNRNAEEYQDKQK